jgi:hypothetical protein
MGVMREGLSLGWLLLLGGILGGVRVWRAKKFSWMNEVDTVVTEDDRQRGVPMTSFRRAIPLGICIVACAVGLLLIYIQHR